MNKIEKLIKEFCLDGVEWKKLGDIGEFYGGITGKRKEDFQNGNAVFITYKNVYNNLSLKIDVEDRVKIYEGEKQRNLQYGDIIFTGSSEKLNECGISSVVTQNPSENLYLNSFCFFLRLDNTDILLPDFSKYLFRSEKLRHQIIKTASGVTRFNVSKEMMKKIEIPIPSLETQEKIVKILDNFTKYVTELQAELHAELQARNKQYNYYRDMLLSEEYLNKISEKFTENQFIEWKMLGELFEFKNGLNKGKNFFGKGTPIINYMDVYKRNKIYSDDLRGLVEVTEDEQKRYSIKRGDVFFTRTSETKEEIGKTSVLLDDVEKGVFSGFVLRARPITELLLPEYCAYCFETYEFRKNVIRYSTYTTRALTNGTTLSNLEIPVPPIEIQNKIVKILDKFQELLFDTKGLLPFEIEQRRKQYEYYREKLLTFDEGEGYALSTAQRQITSEFFELLKEAAKIAGVDISDKVEWKTLGEIAVNNLTYGSGASAIEYDGEVRYVRITDIDTNGNLKEEKFSPSEIEEKYFLNYGDILFARSGATVGKNYIHQSGEKSVYAGYLIRLIVNQKLALPKYIYHCINTTKYFKFVENTKSNGSQPNINAKQYYDFKIPLPPLPVQEYIVSILDKFDILVNDLSQGLPKEIELRQKQYEYYREKLLNFEK